MIKLIKTQGGNYYTADGFHLVNPNIEKDKDYYTKKNKYFLKHLYSNKSSLKFSEIESSDVLEQIANASQLTFEVTDICNLNCSGELF